VTVWTAAKQTRTKYNISCFGQDQNNQKNQTTSVNTTLVNISVVSAMFGLTTSYSLYTHIICHAPYLDIFGYVLYSSYDLILLNLGSSGYW